MAYPIQQYPRVLFVGDQLEFQDLDFNREALRVSAWITEHPECMQFTVLLQEEPCDVWIDKREFSTRFNLSDSLLHIAGHHNQLLRLLFIRAVCHQLFETSDPLTPIKAREITRIQNLLYEDRYAHFRAKKYDLPGPIYIGENWIAGGLPDSWVGEGGFAVIKKAKTLHHELVARRITKVTTKNQRFRALNALDALKKNRDNPGVIPLLGRCIYEKTLGDQKIVKVVTFFPLYDYDLFDLINVYEFRASDLAWRYAHQLILALVNLKGAHRDLKPENILVNSTTQQLVLIDFESYWSQNDYFPDPLCGSFGWAAPESTDPSNAHLWKRTTIDVWPLGMILCYLLTKSSRFRWHVDENIPITQEGAWNIVQHASASPQIKELLHNMLILDPDDRYTIQKVAHYVHTELNDLQRIPIPPPENEANTVQTSTHSCILS